MIIKCIIPILLFTSLYSSFSYEKSIDRAIYHLYNFEFNKSIEILDSLSNDYPIDPLIPFLKISNKWQQALIYDNPESSYIIINSGIKKLIPYYLQMIEQYPDNQDYKLFLGSLYGLSARIYLAKSEWISLVISASKGIGYIKEALEADPDLFDAYMPIGTLEYFLCRSSAPLRIIGRILGLKSDCVEAIKKIEIASTKSRYSWIEAMNVLSYIYLYIEKDYIKALEKSSHISSKFPGHPFFPFLEAESLINLDKITEFYELEDRLISFTQIGGVNQISESQNKLSYLKSIVAYKNSQYDDAIFITTNLINNYKMEFKWVLGYAYLIRGKSYDMKGDRQSAIENYKLSIKFLEKWPAQQEAKYLILNPLKEK